MSTSFHATGSFSWMAPEVILEKQGYGRKADLWSFGCTALESSTAQPPWGKGGIDGMLSAVRLIGYSDQTPPIPDATPAPLRGLLQSCLRRKPEERPSASELIGAGAESTRVE